MGTMDRVFRDRTEAGRALAEQLAPYAGRSDVLVLALPRGGVPVAYEVARTLDVPLDVFLVRKLGLPGQTELAMGAIASGGVRVLNEDVVWDLDIPAAVIDRVAHQEQEELERRERAYRDGRAAPEVHGRIVILVDDGLATGATMRAAVVAFAATAAGPYRRRRAYGGHRRLRRDPRRSGRGRLPDHRPSRSTGSVAGTRTSRRRATRRFERCYRRAGQERSEREHEPSPKRLVPAGPIAE